MAETESYSVLIRTLNSERTLPYTLECLANQTIAPERYIFVDSGSVDGTMNILPKDALVHKFVGPEFNYSDAINQGLGHVSSRFVFVVSSHTIILNRRAVEYALNLLAADQRLGAVYFGTECSGGPLEHKVIDQSNFDGRNGLWNWCALIRMDLLARRKFRPEVFSAEDQEWASWLIHEEGKATARILNAGAINYNPNAQSLRKWRNEEVALAYFVRRDLLGWPNIARVIRSAFRPSGKLHLRGRLSRLILAARLAGCRFSPPTAKSRYF